MTDILYCSPCQLIWVVAWFKNQLAASGIHVTCCPKCNSLLWAQPPEYRYANQEDLPKVKV